MLMFIFWHQFKNFIVLICCNLFIIVLFCFGFACVYVCVYVLKIGSRTIIAHKAPKNRTCENCKEEMKDMANEVSKYLKEHDNDVFVDRKEAHERYLRVKNEKERLKNMMKNGFKCHCLYPMEKLKKHIDGLKSWQAYYHDCIKREEKSAKQESESN